MAMSERTLGEPGVESLARDALAATLAAQPGGRGERVRIMRAPARMMDDFDASATISARGPSAQLGLRLFYRDASRTMLDPRCGRDGGNAHDYFCELANQVIGRLKRALTPLDDQMTISLPMTTLWGDDRFSSVAASARRPLVGAVWRCTTIKSGVEFGYQFMLDGDPATVAAFDATTAPAEDAGEITFF